MCAQKTFAKKEIWLNWTEKQNTFGNYRLI